MSTRETLGVIDAQILGALSAAGLSDTATIGGQSVDGYYSRVWVDEGGGDDAVGGYMQLFDCRTDDLPDVQQGDIITVAGQGQFRVIRQQPDGTGRTMIELGSLL